MGEASTTSASAAAAASWSVGRIAARTGAGGAVCQRTRYDRELPCRAEVARELE